MARSRQKDRALRPKRRLRIERNHNSTTWSRFDQDRINTARLALPFRNRTVILLIFAARFVNIQYRLLVEWRALPHNLDCFLLTHHCRLWVVNFVWPRSIVLELSSTICHHVAVFNGFLNVTLCVKWRGLGRKIGLWDLKGDCKSREEPQLDNMVEVWPE